ncbi:DUF1513 domain-containing protein [Agaribacterium sp. ZY112]|uniref:DUF1513 domain-containing protein n=1 Tax=Agaribacterium sp. ZY112 TaxID=3233574 RepID=UPI003523D6EA
MFSRRQLLNRSAYLPLLAVLPSCTKPHVVVKPNILVGGGQFSDPDGKHFVISTVKYDQLKLNLCPVDFLPHGFHRKPIQKNVMAVFEKKGPGAVIFDIDENKVIHKLSPEKGRFFYGHGAYTADSKELLSTETILDSREGVIGVRDGGDLSYLGEFPSYGQEPHECKLIDSGKTLVVTNGGGPLGGSAPCVTYIDVASQRLLERIELSNKNLNTGHFAISEQGDLVVVSAPRAGLGDKFVGGVSIRKPGGVLETRQEPAVVAGRMYGEALSVAIHDKQGIAVATHPDGDMLTFWSLDDGSLLRLIELDRPRGVTLSVDNSEFIVTYGAQASVARIPVSSLMLDSSSVLNASYLTGSHVYNWSRAMLELGYPGPLI